MPDSPKMPPSKPPLAPPAPSVSGSQPHNVFSPQFLSAMKERDEPASSLEGELAGRWRVTPYPAGGWAVLRDWESLEAGHVPRAVFQPWEAAVVFAAMLPMIGREPMYRLLDQSVGSWFPVQMSGETVGWLREYHPEMIVVIHLIGCILRSPEALAAIVEAAGSSVQELAGGILHQNVVGEGRR